MNLYNDIRRALVANNKTMDDVRWIGCEGFKIPLDNFIQCADIEVDNAVIAEDLILVGDNWYLKHINSAAHINSGFWVFEYIPSEPEVTLEVESIVQTEESEARRWGDDSGDFINSLKYMVT